MQVRDWVKAFGSATPPFSAREVAGQEVPADHSARARGDEARDQRDWTRAVSEYQSYLSSAPDDAAIWVQLGHALKETRAYADAEAAYNTALVITPEDSDLLLQLGHLMKMLGRQNEAIRFYQLSVMRDPYSPAYRELVSLGKSELAAASVSAAQRALGITTTYFQIDDLLAFLSSHKTVSGIQRVQVEVIRAVINRANNPEEPRYAFVYSESGTTRIWEAPSSLLGRLIGYLDEPQVEHASIVAVVDELRSRAVEVKPQAGSSFIILGAFWAAVNNSNILAILQESGVSLGICFYDFIPVHYPEMCDPHLVNHFTQFLAEALSMIDFALAISDFTANEVRRFIEDQGFKAIPVVTVPLAHRLSASLGGIDKNTAYAPVWNAATRELQGRDFVLYVSTIEARKNHKYLFDIWKLLIAEGIDVPDLVFVGRHGWRVSEFMDQLKSTGYLDGRIHILHDLSDRELETLYHECLFTAFTSFVEGWGLPVGESLSYGKLCVSSNSASMPEVGGDFVVYVDPLNTREGLDKIRHLIQNRDTIKQYEATIQQKFTPRTWPEVAANLLNAVGSLAKAHPGIAGNRFVPVIEPREEIQLSDFSPFADPYSERLPRRPKQRAQRLLLTKSWHCPEPFGAWMQGTEGVIRFATKLAPQENAIVFLKFTATDERTENTLTITDTHGGTWKRHVASGETFTIRLTTSTDTRGEIVIHLHLSGTIRFSSSDSREIRIGLISVTFVAESDVIGRAEILERELFDHHMKL